MIFVVVEKGKKMAKKLICDRCSEEINPMNSVKRIAVGGYYYGEGERFDLCVGCGFWLGKFLRDEIRIERKENETD